MWWVTVACVRSRVLTVAAVLGYGFFATSLSAQQQETLPEWFEGQYVVEYKNDPSRTLEVGLAAAKAEQVTLVSETQTLAFDGLQVGAPVTTYIKELDTFCDDLKRADSSVAECGPNMVYRINATPNDPSLGSLWGLTGTNGINAPSAWDIGTGSAQTVVAVVDTGVDYLHPDLAANVWVNPGEVTNGIDDDRNGFVDDIHGYDFANNDGDPRDDNGHGTHVSGTIGAVGNDGRGVVGVSWTVKIMGLKFLTASGSGSTYSAVRSINYITQMKTQFGVNVRVSNNSWGGGGSDASLERAIRDANAAGIVFVAAAGNSAADNDSSASYPANYDIPNVVSVAAIDSNGNLASFSNYGERTVKIAAPGVGILSTIPGNKYASYSGTSMATPHVSGALALLFSQEPSLTVDEAISRLYASGRDLPTLSGLVATGRTLDAARLLTNTTAPVPPAEGGGCNYTTSVISMAPDTAADALTPAISYDDAGVDGGPGYLAINLPFSFPLHGESYLRAYLSPNGAVYFGAAPTGQDYTAAANATSAPRFAIAPLFADLVPVGGTNGVRIATEADRVVISWKAPLYRQTSAGTTTARIALYPSGVVRFWYEFDSASLVAEASARATIGLKGGTRGTAVNYSVREAGKLSNGLALQMTPDCSVPADDIPLINNVNLEGRGSKVNRAEPGKRVEFSANGTGTGMVSMRFGVDGRWCTAQTLPFLAGNASGNTKLPRTLSGKSFRVLFTDPTGASKQASLRIGASTKARRASVSSRSARMSSKKFSTVCETLGSTLSHR